MAPPRHSKPMKLYISISETTIGSMLALDDEHGVESVVYYLSRTLVDAETRYSLIEKLCLALYFSYTKLKYYLIPCEVSISQFNVIRYIFSFSMLHNQVRKWMLAFTEFSLHFVPAKVVKGQALANFLVDHLRLEIKEANIIGMKPWKLYFEGLRHQNGTRVGILLVSPLGEPTTFFLSLTKIDPIMKLNMKP